MGMGGKAWNSTIFAANFFSFRNKGITLPAQVARIEIGNKRLPQQKASRKKRGK